jgi:hypothetical protein
MEVVGPLVVVFLVVLVVIALSSGGKPRNPVKTEERTTSFWGTQFRKIKYHDTGKEVRQEKRQGFFGGTVKKTFVDKQCYRCGNMVASDEQGQYHCCGRVFR